MGRYMVPVWVDAHTPLDAEAKVGHALRAAGIAYYVSNGVPVPRTHTAPSAKG